jgi:hypothetical protein
MYRQGLEEHQLFVLQGTPEVPDDGSYYVLFRGDVVGRFRSLKQATARYQELRSRLNLKPREVPKLTVEELRQRELETVSNKRLLWTDEDFARVDRKTRGRKGTRSAG